MWRLIQIAMMLLVAALVVGGSPVAKADVLVTFSGAEFDDGGSLSGQFTAGTTYCCAIEYNNLFGNTSYSIQSTAGTHPNSLGYELPGSVYSNPTAPFPTDSPVLSNGYKTVDFYSNGNGYAGIFLQLTFANPLSTAGPNAIVSGFECGVGFPCPSTGSDAVPTRYLVDFGTVSAVPEPATWVMLLLGFAALGLIANRGRARPASVPA